MGLLDGSFAREARRYIERSAKRDPGLFALVEAGESPVCIAKVVAVPPGNRYGMFIATDRAFYAWTPNGPKEQWVRVPWGAIKGVLVSSSDRGRNISMFIGLRDDGPGVVRWTPSKQVESLAPQRVDQLVQAGVTILDPYLFNNSTHLRTVVRLATKSGAELLNDGVPPGFIS